MSSDKQYLVDRRVSDQLRYTEEATCDNPAMPGRRCSLWADGVDEDVSEAVLHGFEIRFGATAVPAEGYGGVLTRVAHRKKGYVSKIMRESMAGAATRVDVVFLYGIEKLYGKFGFCTCLAIGDLTVPVSRVETAAPDPDVTLRAMGDGELPALIDLFNAAHARRPWSLHRMRGQWCRLTVAKEWSPGSTVTVAETSGTIGGYMITKEPYLGHNKDIEVQEIVAADVRTAKALLGELGRRCWQRRQAQFMLHEPADSVVGRVACQLGCEVRQRYQPDGGGMACILNRVSLVNRLADELGRRASVFGLSMNPQDVEALASGVLCPEDSTLVRLLLGYWSWDQATLAGASAPSERDALMAAWFPGAPSRTLPMPYAHPLDRY